ncbi:unnamed protein product [Paramecium pentaurelia]|uniref:Uncharacterized protein n=1 Tax=Paramecium pentaurelia TaxID=43138 RepID=A0A8S1X8F2_9CILI|nr:unnamed protein product [Paramecium pentaurelia]
MSKINIPIKKSIVKLRNHKRLEPNRKQSLINLVISENVSIRQAAQKLQIKYSTAKYIMKNFKNNGNQFNEHYQTHNKQNSIIENVNIVIDVSDGSIQLAKTSKKISYCDYNSLQEESKNQNHQQTTEFIYEKLGKIFWHKFHYKEYLDEEILKRFLNRQHILIKQQ